MKIFIKFLNVIKIIKKLFKIFAHKLKFFRVHWQAGGPCSVHWLQLTPSAASLRCCDSEKSEIEGEVSQHRIQWPSRSPFL